MTRKIPYAKPSITELEIRYVTDAITNGWGEHCYDYIYKFQDAFKEYLPVKHALATASCTGALHMVFATLGLRPGDEVIVPDITWSASVVPMTYLGAKPIFVDVCRNSWCIDPSKIEAAITPNTKAILAVHLYGNLAELDQIAAIAKKHNLFLIEDAAEALGSEYKGKKAGAMGDFGVFSFHGTKTVTTGEGGMIVTNRDDLFDRLQILADHGRNPKRKKMFWVEQIGYKYKMSNLQAALGCAQMLRIEELVNKKREIFGWYKSALGKIESLSLNPEPDYTKNSYWMPTVIFDENLRLDREALTAYLAEKGISTRPFFYPNSMFPMYEKAPNPVSYAIYDKGINLPSYVDMTKPDADYVSESLITCLRQMR